MNPLLFAQSGDVASWQTAKDFAAAFQKALRELSASDRIGSVEKVYSETSGALENYIAVNRDLLKNLERIIEEVSLVSSTHIKELTTAFYADLYRHFVHFRSASTFYHLSMMFLCQVSATIVIQTAEQLGLPPVFLKEISLIAIGPTGRREYSPFCPLQILIVHGEATDTQHHSIDLFSHALHSRFEAAGIAVDPVVTPRNDRWRGNMADWQLRCEDALHKQGDDLIDLCRLVDQYPLYPPESDGMELKKVSSKFLNGSHSALSNFIERMTSVSNGVGLMGRLKLERSGSQRGMFNLLDHGLLPFSAALSALALIKGSFAVSNCDRIYDLLKRRELDVELAERMLTTWHTLNGLCLQLEHSASLENHPRQAICLDPDKFSSEQKQQLKETLESVAFIQRHVAIVFSGIGE